MHCDLDGVALYKYLLCMYVLLLRVDKFEPHNFRHFSTEQSIVLRMVNCSWEAYDSLLVLRGISDYE